MLRNLRVISEKIRYVTIIFYKVQMKIRFENPMDKILNTLELIMF